MNIDRRMCGHWEQRVPSNYLSKLSNYLRFSSPKKILFCNHIESSALHILYQQQSITPNFSCYDFCCFGIPLCHLSKFFRMQILFRLYTIPFTLPYHASFGTNIKININSSSECTSAAVFLSSVSVPVAAALIDDSSWVDWQRRASLWAEVQGLLQEEWYML